MFFLKHKKRKGKSTLSDGRMSLPKCGVPMPQATKTDAKAAVDKEW